MAEVIIIPQQDSPTDEERTTRVAAYCRVSSLPQEESYDSQVQHFTSTISAHSPSLRIRYFTLRVLWFHRKLPACVRAAPELR